MQVLFALKGGLIKYRNRLVTTRVYINDIDRDVALAVWLLANHHRVSGTQTIANLNRLLDLTNKLDITAGAYPMNLSDILTEEHNWVFEPYQVARRLGKLFNCTAKRNGFNPRKRAGTD